MRRSALLIAVALVVTPPPAAHAQGIGIGPGEFSTMLPQNRAARTGTGRLRGRITAADTGAIVRRAQVRISGPDIESRTAFTDAQGRYEFRELPAGRLSLSVSKSGFVTMQYGQSRPFQAGTPIDLKDGELMDKADIALPRGSAVSGRILDEFGEPVSDATVSALRLQYAGGKRRLVSSGRPSTTNDHGYFRVFGLPPGEYFLSASVDSSDAMFMEFAGSMTGSIAAGSNRTVGYAATYYPGTQNPAEAQRLSFDVGQEMQIDLQLQPVRLARITGRATTSDGKPMSAAMVMLMPASTAAHGAHGLTAGSPSQTDKDGNFTLTGVPPGEYTVQVQSLTAFMSAATQMISMMGGESKEAPPPAKPIEREFAIANVTVAGDDIAGLVITGARGAKAAGRLVFEGGEKLETLGALHLMAVPTDPDDMAGAFSPFGMAAVKENGAFEIDGLAGTRLFQFMDLPEGWSIKRVIYDGEDITDKGREFKPGEQVEGIEITLTRRTQRLTGAVTSDTGDRVKEYTVIAFAEDQDKWSLPSTRWVASARPNQDGRFELTTLPAGKYLAVAVEYLAEGDWNDPEWLARAATRATRFTLGDGATVTLDLKLLKS